MRMKSVANPVRPSMVSSWFSVLYWKQKKNWKYVEEMRVGSSESRSQNVTCFFSFFVHIWSAVQSLRLFSLRHTHTHTRKCLFFSSSSFALTINAKLYFWLIYFLTKLYLIFLFFKAYSVSFCGLVRKFGVVIKRFEEELNKMPHSDLSIQDFQNKNKRAIVT